ncbi:MAG: carotenoid biosynthesis protein [Planctomycetota bacterium]
METFDLLISTVLLRPYVFVLLGFYLFAGVLQLGLKRIIAFTLLAYTIAFVSEYASTRIGIPYGFYHYTGKTRGVELFISKCAFYGLTFVFLPGVLQLFPGFANSYTDIQERMEICSI